LKLVERLIILAIIIREPNGRNLRAPGRD